jgi:hypothetical protein
VVLGRNQLLTVYNWLAVDADKIFADYLVYAGGCAPRRGHVRLVHERLEAATT